MCELRTVRCMRYSLNSTFISTKSQTKNPNLWYAIMFCFVFLFISRSSARWHIVIRIHTFGLSITLLLSSLLYMVYVLCETKRNHAHDTTALVASWCSCGICRDSCFYVCDENEIAGMIYITTDVHAEFIICFHFLFLRKHSNTIQWLRNIVFASNCVYAHFNFRTKCMWSMRNPFHLLTTMELHIFGNIIIKLSDNLAFSLVIHTKTVGFRGNENKLNSRAAARGAKCLSNWICRFFVGSANFWRIPCDGPTLWFIRQVC